MFLRDNIYRTIAKIDPDFSRQVEGQVIRLHWDEYHLLNLIVKRIREAFHDESESSMTVWNRHACLGISNKEGFQKCLRLTLYRPRDLLVLLNNAFYHAFGHGRNTIHEDDINHSAKEISGNRYADLTKEYDSVFPGLDRMSAAFKDGPGIRPVTEVLALVSSVFSAENLTDAEGSHFKILGTPEFGLQALYSVGFLGLQDSVSEAFLFCHDGSEVKHDFNPNQKCLIHPCYWIALNIQGEPMTPEDAAAIPPAPTEIRDELEIEISSKTPDIRKHRIGQIISALNDIPQGAEGAERFEDWCHQAIAILFVAGLRNVEMKPNGDANQRRDIVARNQGSTHTWKRILNDYAARQVLFEVKNYVDLGPTEYRQMISYLVRDYGFIGFIVTRDADESLKREKDLAWVKEIFFEHKKLIVKLTATWLVKYLSKARSPQKHDAADEALNGLIDRYARNYLSLRKTD